MPLRSCFVALRAFTGSFGFRTRAITGHVAVILLLTACLVLAVRRLDAVASAKISDIRAEEEEIALVESLRHAGEIMLSTGRGYLVSGDADLLRLMRDARVDFDENLASLKTRTLTPIGTSLLAEVDKVAEDYGRSLDQLLLLEQQTEAEGSRARRVEADLWLHRRSLTRSLDRFVRYKQTVIRDVYDRAERDRERLTYASWGALTALVILALGMAWYFTRALARSYAEEQAALESARRAVAARDELLSVVAHDLRNPLGAITMAAAVLLKGSDSDRVRSHAQSIQAIATRMGHLIETMLDVGTIEAGRFTVSPTVCEPHELIGESVDMFRDTCAAKRVRLDWRIPRNAPAVRADRDRVLQVLSNLIGNAIKFTPDGGLVTVALQSEQDAMRFAVSDTGPGIAPEHLSRVFDRFWKRETDGKKGTGLGLFIARGIIAAHGGRIWVESDLGRGATFYFTLPTLGREATPAPGELGAHPPMIVRH